MRTDVDIDKLEEEQLLRAVVSLNTKIVAIGAGFILGSVIFAVTLFLVLKGGPVVGPHLSLLSQFYPGYRVTAMGSLVGSAYGFATGCVAGMFIGRIYNQIVDFRSP